MVNKAGDMLCVSIIICIIAGALHKRNGLATSLPGPTTTVINILQPPI